MCGIAGVHVKPKSRGKLNVGKMLDTLLLGIESRGKEATGYIAVSFDRQMEMDKRAVTASEFIKKRKKLRGQTQTVLAHTRLATQGSVNDPENNHPVQFNTTFATHNGMVWNDADLVQEYGWERPAEVDSIVIPALIHELGMENVGDAMEKLEGYAAIAALDVTEPGRVVVARGVSSPLVYIETDMFIAWASSTDALRGMWGACFGTPPAWGKFTHAPEGTLLDIQDGELTKSTFEPQELVYRSYSGYTSGGGWGYDPNKDFSYSGHWVEDKGTGTRTWKSTGSALPSLRAIDTVRAYSEWAEVDNEMHQTTIEHLAHELNLDVELTCWLAKNLDEELLRREAHIREVAEYIKGRYTEIYDKVLKAGNYHVTKQECIFCGDPVEGGDQHCGPCKRINADEYTPGDILKDALKANSDPVLLEQFVKAREMDRKQAIAEGAA